MSPALKPPADCASMAELRDQIDAIDAALVALFAQRAPYIDRAVELKQVEGLPANTTDRVAQVAALARRRAEAAGLDPDFAETMWRTMMDWFIAHEEKTLGKG